MNIIIQSLGFTASENLKQFVEAELGKLIHKDDMIVRANVTLYKASDSILDNNYREIRLEVPGNDLFAKRSSDTFEKRSNKKKSRKKTCLPTRQGYTALFFHSL